MPVKLYHFAPSPPSRSVLLTCRALELDVEVKVVNLFEKEQLKDDFVKINPQHCIPTIDDDGFVLWESRAINTYLASKYSKKGDVFYPNDVQKRATVDRLLYFDGSTFFPRTRAIIFPVIFLGEKTIPQDKKDSLNEAFSFLNGFLENNQWVAGTDHYTVADLALLASATTIMCLGWDVSKYPNVQKWLEKCKTLPGYKENHEGATILADRVKSNLNPEELEKM